MHESQAGLDLISLYKLLGVSDKVFSLYLLLVLLFSFARSLQLGRRLWCLPHARPNASGGGDVDAAELLALKELPSKLGSTKDLSNWRTSLAKDESSETSSQIVTAATQRFDYLLDKIAIGVAGMKDLAILTLILCGLFLSLDFMKFLSQIQSGRYPVHDDFDVAGGPAELLVPIVLGFAVSAALYAISSLFSRALAHRKTAWHLFVAHANGQCKAE